MKYWYFFKYRSNPNYDATVLDFRKSCATQTSYIQGSNVSSEWVLLYDEYEKKNSTDTYGVTFNEIHFIYTLQRMPSFYIITMIIPIWLIFALSMFVFYLPAQACEKMTLSISILIGQTVFLTLLAKRVPETSVEIPLLGGYLLFTMSMVSIAVVCSVIVCNIFHRSTKTHTLPKILQVIFIDYIARYEAILS